MQIQSSFAYGSFQLFFPAELRSDPIEIHIAFLVILLVAGPIALAQPTFFGFRSSGTIRECELFMVQFSFGSGDETYTNYTIPDTDCSAAGNYSSALLWHTLGSRFDLHNNSDTMFDLCEIFWFAYSRRNLQNLFQSQWQRCRPS